MGNDVCATTPQGNQHAHETLFADSQEGNSKQKPTLDKPQPNNNRDDGLNPLVTTFRDIADKYRARSRSKTPSPQKRTTRKSPQKQSVNSELDAIRRKLSPTKRTNNELTQHVDDMLRRGRESKLKLEIKRREKELVAIEERPSFQPNSRSRPSLKIDEFLRGQELFQERKKASVQRQRQELNKQLNGNHTHKPTINSRSRRLVEQKQSRETPIDKITVTEPRSGQQACELGGSASPIRLKTIVLEKPEKKKLKLTRGGAGLNNSVYSVTGSSNRSTSNHLASKLIKQFNTALQLIGRAGFLRLSYIEFCEVMRLMGMVSRQSDCNSFPQAEQRALLSQAYNIIAEGAASVKCYSVLSLALAIFGIDINNHLSKLSLDTMRLPSELSRSIELPESSPTKQNTDFNVTSTSKEMHELSYKSRYRSPPKESDQPHQSVPTAMKHDECQQTVASPLDMLADSRLNRSLRELMKSRSQADRLGVRTKYFVRFRQDEIAELQSRFKTFYHSKMSQAKSAESAQLHKTSVDRTSERSLSRSSRKSLVSTNVLSVKHKNKVIDQAIRHSLVHPTTKLQPVEVLHLERLVVERENEERKLLRETKQLAECTFQPRTNCPSKAKEQPMRHLYLYELGKERVMYRADRQQEEDTEQCSFQPNLALTKSYKPATKTIRLGDYKNCRAEPLGEQSQRKRIMRTNQTEATQRILEIRVDLGKTEEVIYVDRSDNPDTLAKSFLEQHGLPMLLHERLALIITDGMHRAARSTTAL